MRKLKQLAVLTVLAATLVAALGVAPAGADNETNLSFFSCAVTRPDPPGSTTPGQMTVNHSHRIASKSSPGHYDWFDCEDYRTPGINGCVYATYYIYDVNPATGQPYGIFGPFNVTCFGDWPA